jgi:tRNA threonylcarbamoyladenosine biosynthesis protein TsaB
VLILALDTSSSSGSLAFLRDESVIATIGTASGEIYSSRVFRHLEFLLGEVALGLEDFDVFAVAAGPGSFTGLRVGLAAVKGWAEVFGKPIAAISALEAIAMQAGRRAATVVPVMDARRKELYWGFYRQHDSHVGAPLVLENHECVGPGEELVRAIANCEGADDLTIVTPTPEAITGAVSVGESFSGHGRPVSIERVSPFLAAEIGRLGLIRSREGKVVDALTLDANYIRRSDAELHWKGSAGS